MNPPEDNNQSYIYYPNTGLVPVYNINSVPNVFVPNDTDQYRYQNYNINSVPNVFVPNDTNQFQIPAVIHQTPQPIYSNNYIETEMVPLLRPIQIQSFPDHYGASTYWNSICGPEAFPLQNSNEVQSVSYINAPSIVYLTNYGSTGLPNSEEHNQMYFSTDDQNIPSITNSNIYGLGTPLFQNLNQFQTFMGNDVMTIGPSLDDYHNTSSTIYSNNPYDQDQLETNFGDSTASSTSIYGSNFTDIHHQTFPTIAMFPITEAFSEQSNNQSALREGQQENDPLPTCSRYIDETETLQPYGNNQLASLANTNEQPVPVQGRAYVPTGGNPFECNECGSCFIFITHLRRHMRTHMGAKPYKCPYCEKAYAKGNRLNRHLRVHSDEKPYKCLQCGKQFRERRQCNIHIRIHTSDKPFQCKLCKKYFSQPEYLRRHERHTHIGGKIFPCSTCKKVFGHPWNLERHERTHTR